jgi:prepilin-type N-terminal cleavage/methylation domain-containing protein
VQITERYRKAAGFTLIELLIVVAIIGLLASIAVPVYANILERTNRNAFVADADTLYKSFMRYYIDNGSFPPDSGPGSFDPDTMVPLITHDYLTATAAASFLRKQVDNTIAIYVAPDVTGASSDLLIAMRPRYDLDEMIYIFYTDLLDDSYGPLDGVYFYRNSELIRIDGITE